MCRFIIVVPSPNASISRRVFDLVLSIRVPRVPVFGTRVLGWFFFLCCGSPHTDHHMNMPAFLD